MKRLAAVLLLLPAAAFAQGTPLPDGIYAEISKPRGLIPCELDFSKAP